MITLSHASSPLNCHSHCCVSCQKPFCLSRDDPSGVPVARHGPIKSLNARNACLGDCLAGGSESTLANAPTTRSQLRDEDTSCAIAWLLGGGHRPEPQKIE